MKILKASLLIFSFFMCRNMIILSQDFIVSENDIEAASSSAVAWGDYDNDADLDFVISGNNSERQTRTTLYKNLGPDIFEKISESSFADVESGSLDWGDYDNDGDLDLLLTGSPGSWEPLTKIYRNNSPDSSGFSALESAGIIDVRSGDAKWGDYNNDGLLDIAICGNIDPSCICKIYRNLGNGSFSEQKGIQLTGVCNSRLAWNDFNNDSYLDLVVCGETNGEKRICELYKNNGDNSFTNQIQIELPGVKNGSVDWGDYNDDGYSDLLITGEQADSAISLVFVNDAGITLSESNTISLHGIGDGSSAQWADIDNDGKLDIVLAGSGRSYLYLNNGDDTFSEHIDDNFWGLSASAIALGDADNDGDLDLLITGDAKIENVWKSASRLLLNNSAQSNSDPSPPSNLQTLADGNMIVLSWDKSSDTESRQNGLSYNLSIRYKYNDSIILSPEADLSSGYRKFPKIAYTHTNHYTFNRPDTGTYIWRVQAIDHGLASSNFSVEDTFRIDFKNFISPVSNQILKPNETGVEIHCTETDIANSREWRYSTFSGGPYNKVIAGEEEVSFTPFFNEFGTYYVVCVSYKDNIVSVSKEVKISVPLYSELATNDIIGFFNGSVEWGDYDQDGFMDLAFCGNIEGPDGMEVYHNNGDSTFSKYTKTEFYGLERNASLAWGDFDNDGDLDILVSGDSVNYPDSKSRNTVAFIYENMGDSIFYCREDIAFNGVHDGKVDWCDFDRDGDLDVLMAGNNKNEDSYANIYWNNNQTFALADISLRGGQDFAINDYNSDTYPDILILGSDINANVHATIYKNIDGESFEEQNNIVLDLFINASSEWADFDNDGLADIIIHGLTTNQKSITRIYKNNDQNSYIETGVLELFASFSNDLKSADVDNDGDLDLLYNGGGKTRILKNEGGLLFNTFNGIELPEIERSSSDFGDFDNDGDLDLAICGVTDEDSVLSKILMNNSNINNTPPSVPENLTHSIQGNSIRIIWDECSDNETPSTNLSYNIAVGSVPGGIDILAPMSGENGKRYITEDGNCYLCEEFTLNNLDTGTYYYRVQCIDNGLLASGFSEEQAFTILPTFTEDTSVNLSGIQQGSVSWVDYDNDGDLDVILSGNGSYYPEYTHISEVYMNNGAGELTLNNEITLKASFDSHLDWADYNGDGYIDLILTGTDEDFNPFSLVYRNSKTGNFVAEPDIYKPEEIVPALWGDYDNNGDIDILGYEGFPCIYGNFTTDSGKFVDIKIWFPGGINRGSWADYDNDSDIDLLIFNDGSLQFFTNNNNKTFSEDKEHSIPLPIGSGSPIIIANSDYDNDGDLDFILSAEETNGNNFLELFKNEGDFEFVRIDPDLRKATGGDIKWGDFDNDGYPDLILTGQSSGRISHIYKNNREGSFQKVEGVEIEGLISSSVAWGDYDGDGDLDLLASGDGISAPISKVFSNNSNYKNSEPTTPLNLKSEVYGSSMKLSWDEAFDPDCPDGKVYYNIRIGSTPGAFDILSPSNIPGSSQRTVAKIGNVACARYFIINGLDPYQDYYWSVQAIDQSFLGGDWAEEQLLEVKIIRADFQNDTVCFGSKTAFQDLSLSTQDPITHWIWNFGDGDSSSFQNPVHLYSKADTFAVQLIALSDQDADTITKNIIVKPKPIANFLTENLCYGEPLIVNNQSDAQGLTITSWDWAFGDNQTSNKENPGPHYYAQPGEYSTRLILKSDNSCGDTLIKQLIVAEYPTAVITANGPVSFCEGNNVELSVSYDPDYSYQWKLDDIPISDSIKATCHAIYNGNYSVEIENILATCLSKSSPLKVEVKSAPISPFISVSGDTIFCEGDSTILSVPDISGYAYRWKINGFATELTSSQCIAKTSGTYSVEIFNSSGCIAESYNSVSVKVNKSPNQPVMSQSGSINFCSGDSLILSVEKQPDVTYQWKNENGKILDANANLYICKQSGEFSVNISNISKCSTNSDTIEVSVSEIPSRPILLISGYNRSNCPEDKLISIWIDQATEEYNYQWKRNGVPMDEETEVELEGYLKEGNYSVVANNNGCTSESNEFNVLFDKELPEKPEIIVRGPEIWYLACSNDTAPSYQWLLNDKSIPQANSYLFVADQVQGKYQVKLSNNDGCYAYSDPIWIPLGTGIGENPWKDLKIYPNPAPGLFTLEMDNNIMGELIIDIFGETGSKILNIKLMKETSHFQTQIDLSGQPSETYLIKLTIESFKTTRQLIIE